jgi:hypothetical protein
VPPGQPKRTQEDFGASKPRSLKKPSDPRADRVPSIRTSEEIAPLAGQEFAAFTPQAQAGS